MFVAKSAVFGALVAATLASAGPAMAYGFVSQESSPAFWGPNGEHADLVMYYDRSASGPLTIVGIYFVDLSGATLSQNLISCGQANPDGSRSLNPGQYCFVRSYRGNAGFITKTIFKDNTANSGNTNAYVRTSVEVRTVDDAPITHMEER